ncbi:MAG: prephenate dehydratase [Mycobacteriaceae bacterium]
MLRITYFGPSGTFTEAALAQMEANGTISKVTDPVNLSPEITRIAAVSPSAALELVRTGAADYACVPIESSVEGPVPPTLDALATGARLQIFGEVELAVSFEIVIRPGFSVDQIRTIAAYPVAAAQVRSWLAVNFPAAEILTTSSNAAAAEDVSSFRVDAGVSTTLAAQRLGLESVASDVADVAGARTRFVLVGRPGIACQRTGSDRTSVVLTLANRPGALGAAIAEFSVRDIDLTRIESRPMRTELGSYRFFLDCVGHIDDIEVSEALKALYRKSEQVLYLGSWPSVHLKVSGAEDSPDACLWLSNLKAGRVDL